MNVSHSLPVLVCPLNEFPCSSDKREWPTKEVLTQTGKEKRILPSPDTEKVTFRQVSRQEVRWRTIEMSSSEPKFGSEENLSEMTDLRVKDYEIQAKPSSADCVMTTLWWWWWCWCCKVSPFPSFSFTILCVSETLWLLGCESTHFSTTVTSWLAGKG